MVMNFLYAVGLIKKMMMKTKREEISGNQSLSSHLRRLMLDSEVTFIFQCLLFYFLHLPFPSLSLSLSYSFPHKSKSVNIYNYRHCHKEKSNEIIKKGKTFFLLLYDILFIVYVCAVLYFIYFIYTSMTTFSKGLSLVETIKDIIIIIKRKSVFFLPFSFHINIHLIYIAELSSFR